MVKLNRKQDKLFAYDSICFSGIDFEDGNLTQKKSKEKKSTNKLGLSPSPKKKKPSIDTPSPKRSARGGKKEKLEPPSF